MDIGNPESINGAVTVGLGISVVSRTSLHKGLRLGTLAALALSPPMDRPFPLIFQKRKFRSRASQDILAFTRKHFHGLHKCPITSTR